jgi:hypothetical protein
VDTDVKYHRSGNAAEALRESGDSPDPRIRAFLDVLATIAAKQLLMQLDAAESKAEEEQR